jgi:hypothetical protein
VTIDTSNTEPISIIPGDTVKWALTLADYPASAGWALSYELLNTMHRLEIHAAAEGKAFRASLSPRKPRRPMRLALTTGERASPTPMRSTRSPLAE